MIYQERHTIDVLSAHPVTQDCTARFHHAKLRQNVTTTHGIQMVNVSPDKDGCHAVRVHDQGVLTEAYRLDILSLPECFNQDRTVGMK